MIGDIKGYCILKSTNTIMGYAGDPEELIKGVPFLRIIDIAVDNSGFMVLNPQGNALAVVDMPDIDRYFLCDEMAGVLIPPDLNFGQQLIEAHRRSSRKGGYNEIIRRMVIVASLHAGKFCDDFLFELQED